MIGTNRNEEGMQAEERRAWLYVAKLKRDTTVEKVERFLIKKGIAGEIDCEELTTQGTMKAFKVGIPLYFLNTVSDPEFWPSGVLMRRFRLPRRQTRFEGTSLE